MKSIQISENLWKCLSVLKLDLNVSTYEEVIYELYEIYIREVREK